MRTCTIDVDCVSIWRPLLPGMSSSDSETCRLLMEPVFSGGPPAAGLVRTLLGEPDAGEELPPTAPATMAFVWEGICLIVPFFSVEEKYRVMTTKSHRNTERRPSKL